MDVQILYFMRFINIGTLKLIKFIQSFKQVQMETNQLNQAESNNNFVQYSTKFTKDDLIKGLKISQSLGVKVQEKPCTSQDELIEKYQALKNFKNFMQSMDSEYLSCDPTENSESSKNRKKRKRRQNGIFAPGEAQEMTMAQKQKAIQKKYLQNIAQNVDRSMPIIDSSGDEEMQLETDAEGNIKKISKENDADEEMFAQDSKFFQRFLDKSSQEMTDEEYVKLKIKQNRCFFNVDRGHSDAKKANLGDIKSTRIESPLILNEPVYGPKEAKTTIIKGNIKAIIPLMREKFALHYEDNGGICKEKYRRVETQKLSEKRIFGILTKYQVGFIPNLQISFTEDEQNFNRDTYLFKPLINDGETTVDINDEIHKQNVVNDFEREDIRLDEEDQIIEVGTINQIETFHRYLISDLYKRHKVIDFEKCFSDENISKTKKYYIVPLKLDKGFQGLGQNQIKYRLDSKLLKKVESLASNGYKNQQKSIINYLNDKQLFGDEERQSKLNEIILVKEDKPSNCYTFHKVLENLKDMPAEEVATAIRGKPENLNCKNGFDFIFNAPTRFNCIKSFRQLLNEKDMDSPGYSDTIKNSPIILLNPAKPIHQEKLYKYDLLLCPKKPNKKNDDRRAMKQRNDLTTNQGMPIFSAFNIYKHYLNVTAWNRASQLPQVLSFFERCLNASSLIAKFQLYVHPEFAVWATSCLGVSSSRKSYQTLETYGDTILKVAGTMLADEHLKNDPNVNEGRLGDIKNSFISNLCIYRLGQKMKLREHMRMKDPDYSKYEPPFAVASINTEEFLSCTGKNIADGVESILGAVFLSNNLHKTLQFISDIDLIPLQQANLLRYFPDKDLTFHLKKDLDAYNFDLDDTVQDIFSKYYSVDQVPGEEMTRINQIIDPTRNVRELGFIFDDLRPQNFNTQDLKNHLVEQLAPVEAILNYKFKNKYLLLEAFSHSSFTETNHTGNNYEILEVLGDAVLDYVANSNLIKFTMFERYNIQERVEQEFVTSEDFQPFDAHQAKSMLTKNNFLAEMMCLFGLQEYILVCQKRAKKNSLSQVFSQGGQILDEKFASQANEIDQNDKPEWWNKKKQEADVSSQYTDALKFIKYSFKKDFKMNSFEFEPYKAPKILGDVFEAIIGALFKDGGIEETIRVLKSLMAPFVLYVAKYSKKINKEPKEDFQQLAIQLKIKPLFKSVEGKKTVRISEVIQLREDQEDIEDQWNRVDVIYNNGQTMTSAYGSTKQQAEKNASIKGLKWLAENRSEEIKNLLEQSKYNQSLRASFMQYSNFFKQYVPDDTEMD